MDRIAIDLLALPETANGNIGVVTAVDVFSKFCWAYPIRDKSSSSVARALLQLMADYGRFHVLQSDNGKEFNSRLVAEFCRRADIRQLFVSTYNPRSNGMVERVNRVLVEMLRRMSQWDPTAWEDLLPMALHAYRSRVHTSTGYTPYRLMFGRESSLTAEWRTSDIAVADEATQVLERAQDLIRLHTATYDHARRNIDRAAEKYTRGMDRRHGRLTKVAPIPIGTSVLVRQARRGHTTAGKMKAKYKGPYTVVRVNSVGNYELLDTDGTILDRSVPRNFLKVAREGVEEIKAEPVRILSWRETDLGVEVYVRWITEQEEGRPQEEWLAEEDVVSEEAARAEEPLDEEPRDSADDG